MRKRVLSFVLALCLLLALMPQTSLTAAAYSDTDIAYAVEGGDLYFDKETGTITGCTNSVTSAVIPAEIDGTAVTGIADYAFGNCTHLTTLTIPDSITSIGDCVFLYCASLTGIEVDEGNLYYSNDDFGALFNKDKTELILVPQTKAEGYTIPESVTRIGTAAFQYYEDLTSITIPDSVETIGEYAFYECENLSSLTIGNGVTCIEPWAFYRCFGLTSVVIPNSVTTIGYGAFYAGFKLTSVMIGNSVTAIEDYAFYGCSKLVDVVIPDSVETIGEYAFDNCRNLATVTIGSGVVSIGKKAFAPTATNSCNLLAVCFLGDAPSIGEDVFRSAYIGEFEDGYVEYSRLILYYMDGKTGWTSPEWNGYPTATWDGINLPERNTAYAVEGGNLTFDKHLGMIVSCDETVTSAEIPAEINGTAVTTIGDNAFSGLTNLTSVTISGSVTTIGSSAFENCENLTSVTLEEGITDIGYYAFYGCSSLSNFTIPDSVTRIGHLAFSGTRFSNTNANWTDGVLYKDNWLLSHTSFDEDYTLVIPEGIVGMADALFWDNWYNLKHVVLPSTLAVIPEQAFGFAWSLTGVTIPEGVKEIKDNAFVGCRFTSISIPASVTSIGDDAFTQCSYLTGIWVDEKNPNYSSDDCGVLYNKDKTELIKAPGALKGEYAVPNGVTTIDAKAFSYSRLTDVTIPNTVEEIGERAFERCYFLISATIPRNITSLERGTFYFCNDLTSVYFCGDAPELGESVFHRISEGGSLPTLTLYYAEGKSGWTSPTWNGYNTATWEPPHEHSYTAAVTNPTCTEQGYTTHTCECGDSYVDSYVDALGHDFVINTCSRCGAKGTGKNFSDVSDESWFYDYVVAASNLGLVNGYEDNTFRPFGSLTRAEAVTLLYRAAGSPAVTGRATFTDLDGQWYQDAICWAQQNKVVNGISATEFAPNEPVTREAFLTMIWRAAGRPDATGSLNDFKDTATVDEWAVTAFAWAVEQGIINGTTLPGKTGLHLAPLNNITRAEAAKILVVYTGL